jgi:hypothetical protein
VKKLLFFLPLMTVFCGCNIFLPAGKAPEGAITDNSPEIRLSCEEVQNNAVTALAAFLLMHPEISALRASDPVAEKVLREAATVTGTLSLRSSAYTLVWRNGAFRLSGNNGTLLWQYPGNAPDSKP